MLREWVGVGAAAILALAVAGCTGPGNGPPPGGSARAVEGHTTYGSSLSPDAEPVQAIPDSGPGTNTGEQFGPYYGPDTGRNFWGYN